MDDRQDDCIPAWIQDCEPPPTGDAAPSLWDALGVHDAAESDSQVELPAPPSLPHNGVGDGPAEADHRQGPDVRSRLALKLTPAATEAVRAAAPAAASASDGQADTAYVAPRKVELVRSKLRLVPSLADQAAAAGGDGVAAAKAATNKTQRSGSPLIATPRQETTSTLPVPLPTKARRDEGQRTATSATHAVAARGSPTPDSGAAGAAAIPRFHSHPALQRMPLPSLDPVQMYPLDTTVELQYEIGRCIGEGTYGSVHAGRHRLSGRCVALKRLKCLASLEGFPLTSLREVMVHRHLRETLSPESRQHFSLLVDTLLSGNGNDVYLVFDFVEHSLSGLMQRRMQFDVDEVLYFIRGVAEGARVLHECHVMHRDIKPNNTLITASGEVKLCDFGLALPTSSERARMTPSLVALAYRPPEMLLGCTKYTTAIDVWSLGCMLGHVLLGIPPFYDPDHKTEAEQLVRIVTAIGSVHQMVPETRRDCSLFAARSQTMPDIKPSADRFREWFIERQSQRRQTTRVPDSVVMLLRWMLMMDPSQRPTMAQVLEHPVMKHHKFESTRQRLVDRLKQVAHSHDGLLKAEQLKQQQRQQTGQA